jgi:hypothetical protein
VAQQAFKIGPNFLTLELGKSILNKILSPVIFVHPDLPQPPPLDTLFFSPSSSGVIIVTDSCARGRGVNISKVMLNGPCLGGQLYL